MSLPLRWKLYIAVCFLQMLSASYFTFTSLILFFESTGFSSFIRTILYLLVTMLAILGINILTKNYPNIPVAGKQKSGFNWIFLLNFLFLVILFGIIFSEYRLLKQGAAFLDTSLPRLPFIYLSRLLFPLITLIFQFIILYGLYVLRRELYINFMSKQFDFEKGQSSR